MRRVPIGARPARFAKMPTNSAKKETRHGVARINPGAERGSPGIRRSSVSLPICTPHQRLAHYLLTHRWDRLNGWERTFCRDIAQRLALTPRQAAKLLQIARAMDVGERAWQRSARDA